MLRTPLSREIATVFAISMLLTAAIIGLGDLIPLIGENSLALVALVFLYLPILALKRRGLDAEDFGLTLTGATRGIRTGLLMVAITIPIVEL